MTDAQRAGKGMDWLPISSAPKDGKRIAIRFTSGNEHEATWRTTYGGEWHVDDCTFLPWADQHNITEWHALAAYKQAGMGGESRE